MDIRGIVATYLRNNGYDGLCQPGECACSLGDLTPCGALSEHCQAGVFAPCYSGQHEYHIIPIEKPDGGKMNEQYMASERLALLLNTLDTTLRHALKQALVPIADGVDTEYLLQAITWYLPAAWKVVDTTHDMLSRAVLCPPDDETGVSTYNMLADDTHRVTVALSALRAAYYAIAHGEMIPNEAAKTDTTGQP